MQMVRMCDGPCPDCGSKRRLIGQTVFGDYAVCCRAELARLDQQRDANPGAAILYVKPLPVAGDLFAGVNA